MTDPPGTILPSAGTGGLDGLLTTKLYLPRRRPGFITRPRLTERLDESLARGLVLVCAPAGFGKTALLADWACPQRRPGRQRADCCGQHARSRSPP
jgi:LuxR family transcriptional regulator, maltose regulon positive regulatory protein